MAEPRATPTSLEDRDRRYWKGFGNFVDRIAPSLFELGLWLFGSLIAFHLLILASLFTVGPVDAAVKIATAAFAVALPLDLTGLFLLRLVQELKRVGFEDQLVQAFHEEGVVSDQIPAPPDLDATLAAMHAKRTAIVLRFSSGILWVSILLTLAGLISTFWHMAWWIALIFLAMVVISVAVAILAMALSQPADSRKQE